MLTVEGTEFSNCSVQTTCNVPRARIIVLCHLLPAFESRPPKGPGGHLEVLVAELPAAHGLQVPAGGHGCARASCTPKMTCEVFWMS